jgi:hypothetical protein
MNRLVGRFVEGWPDPGWTRVIWVVDELQGGDDESVWTQVRWGAAVYNCRAELIVADRAPRFLWEQEWWQTLLARLSPNGRVVLVEQPQPPQGE